MGMIALKCPQCGADIQLDDTREFGFCNYCGTKVMQDKVVVEHKGNVTVDNSEKVNNLYQLARRATKSQNYDSAATYYNQILIERPNDWEAQFYVVYCEAMSCRIMDISNVANKLTLSAKSVPPLIDKNDDSEEEKILAVTTVLSKCFEGSECLYNAAKSHYNKFKEASNSFGEFSGRANNCIGILGIMGQAILSTSLSNISTIKETVATYLEINNTQIINWFEFFAANAAYIPTGIPSTYIGLVDENTKYIREIKPDYVSPSNRISQLSNGAPKTLEEAQKKQGCYVATAIYGSYDCPEVWTLRRFRDYSLALTWYGRLFITLYYAISPTIVKWFGHTHWFNKMWKGKLDRMVEKLQSEGYENTPYEDRIW